MRREEVRALGELIAEAAAGTAGQIEEMHMGVVRRVWRGVGPMSLPVRIVHDRLAGAGYTVARAVVRGAVRRGVDALALTQYRSTVSLHDDPWGRALVGALNGVWGDTLARSGNRLALEMTVRHAGRDVPLVPSFIGDAFPDAQRRVAVFVHGLCETDDAWMLGAERHVPYGYRLAAELGYTPVYLRYNSGLHVSENGRQLARVLEALLDAWPVEVHEVALVGHSMGGLVARSACHYGAGGRWVGRVRHVFTLGSPHLGAPLERAANVASYAFSRLPETRALLARPLNRRSAGIKDLRFGYLTDECWDGQDCDAFLRDRSREVPFLATASHYFLCATLARDPEGPSARIIGDLLVLPASAWARRRGEALRFPIEHYHHVGAVNHFQLLNHPAIYAQIRRWMAPRRALPAGAPTG